MLLVALISRGLCDALCALDRIAQTRRGHALSSGWHEFLGVCDRTCRRRCKTQPGDAARRRR